MRILRIAAVLLSVLAIVSVAQGQGADQSAPGPLRVFMGKADDGRPAIWGRAHPSPNEQNDDRLLRNAVLTVNGANLRITADEVAVEGEALVLTGNVRITLNPSEPNTPW
jgi:hypothetical protein